MCNEAARRTALGLMREDFSQLKIRLRFPEGLPNLGEAPSIRITDSSVIVRAAPADPRDAAEPEMVQRRWSWLGPAGAGKAAGKPVYNYRAEGRRFDFAPGDGSPTQGRCLIPLDGFYEFTDAAAAATLTLPLPEQSAPPAPPTGAGKKAKWRFTLSPDAGPAWNPAGRAAPGMFAVAGLWRVGVDLGKAGGVGETRRGEAFTMLTCAPGPDIAPYHGRQIVLLPRDRWADWLGIGDRGMVPAAELIAPTPAGTLLVTRAR